MSLNDFTHQAFPAKIVSWVANPSRRGTIYAIQPPGSVFTKVRVVGAPSVNEGANDRT